MILKHLLYLTQRPILPISFIRYSLAFLSLLIVLSAIQFHTSDQLTPDTKHAKGRDFFIFYLAGSLGAEKQASSVYDQEIFYPLLNKFFKLKKYNYYSYPPTYTALLTPFSYLPYKTSFLAWMFFQSFLYVLGCYFFIKNNCRASSNGNTSDKIFFHVVNITLFLGLPITILSLNWGQNGVFFAGICLLAFSFKNKPFVQGMLLSLAMVKPHLLVLFTFYFFGERNFRLLLGLAIGTAICILASVPIVGTSVWEAYITYIFSSYNGLLAHYNTYTVSPYFKLAGFDQQTIRLIQAFILLLFSIFSYWLGRQKAPGHLSLCIIAMCTAIASPYFNCYDYVLMCVLFLTRELLDNQNKASLSRLVWIITVYMYSLVAIALDHKGISVAPLTTLALLIFIILSNKEHFKKHTEA